MPFLGVIVWLAVVAASTVLQFVLLESSKEVIHDRILARGENEDCWCMRHIDDCLSAQRHFEDVIRVQSVGQTVDELAKEVVQRLQLSVEKELC